MSLPSRERGLKSLGADLSLGTPVSLPSRERGLKLLYLVERLQVLTVAPLAGARIEIV